MLLDTHTWFWYVTDHPTLKRSVRLVIEKAEQKQSLFLCPISLWEITLKVSQGKMHLGLPVRLWLEMAIKSTGIHLTEIDIDVACECADLPSEFHGDPGDRLIAATARTRGMILVTHDKTLLQLSDRGYFKALAT